jgi:Fe-S-cluster containining protein
LPWTLGGECQRCARCCEAPAIRVGFWTYSLPTLRRLFLWWQRAVNGFELVARLPGQRAFSFRCTHFDGQTRECDSYASRPGMCRDYPRLVLHQANPEFLAGCGYRAVARNASGLIRRLERAPLAPERRAQLKKDLRLE